MESSGFSGHNWLMIDGSLWARSVAIPLHWEASKDEQLLPPGGQIKQKLRWIIFPSRKKKAQKGKLMHGKEERKKERKKQYSQISATCEFSYRNVVTFQNYIVRLILKTRKWTFFKCHFIGNFSLTVTRISRASGWHRKNDSLIVY